MDWLHRRDHIQGGKTRQIGWVQHLRVFDAMAQV